MLQLGLSCVAIVWLFLKETSLDLDRALLREALYFSVATLIVHVCQYLVMSAVWGATARYYERKLRTPTKEASDDEDIKISSWTNAPAVVCFWTKSGLLFASYGLLMGAVARAL